jgi:Zn-dependent membrane protease YugP
MESTNLTTRYEHDKAADALQWAARTYVVAALASVAQLVYFISVYLGRSRD